MTPGEIDAFDPDAVRRSGEINAPGPDAAVRPGEIDAFDPDAVRRQAPILTAALRRWFRADVRGLERLPPGRFLGVGNHSGATLIPDTLLWVGAHHLLGRSPPLLTLAHDGMFDIYPGWLARGLSRLGAIRASRDNALEALRRGYSVQVYPGGDYDACRSFRRRHEIVFGGRTGYVTIAREAGVPIVPVVAVGGHEALLVLWDGAPLARALGLHRRRLTVFPLSLSLPWGLFLGPLPGYLPLPTKISIEVLDPVDPSSGSVAEIDARVRAAMQAAADALAASRRFPVIG